MKRSRCEEQCELETKPPNDDSSIPKNRLLFSPTEKMKQCVRFSETTTCSSVTTFLNYDTVHDFDVDSNCKSSLYYSRIELFDIRKALQKLCLEVRQDISNYNGSSVSTKTKELFCQHQYTNISNEKRSKKRKLSLAINTETRGVEQLICFERRRRKRLSNDLIIKASSRLYKSCHPDRTNLLSSIAKRCTAWATTVAIEEGIRDYCRAYDIPLDDIL